MTNTKKPFFKKAAIIGVGLIGGSIAMVMKEKGIAGSITGVGRGRGNLETALKMGLVDTVTTDLAEGVSGADLVIAAVPVQRISEVIKKALPALSPPCIITDVGSVKKAVIDAVEPLLPEGIDYVPAHPVAGTEESGAGAAFAGLFEDRVCVMTPTGKTNPSALARVKSLWQEAGSKVVLMEPDTHDRVFSAVSHLPHIVAYTLVNTVAGGDGRELLKFSAGGFRDFTRIASSSPEMWTDICAMNRDCILEMIDKFQFNLDQLKKLLKDGNLDGVREEFEKAKAIRDSIL